jgi:alpha-D-ribose 1-methylphosphonate 5-triphosphate synthase subunit PhnH
MLKLDPIWQPDSQQRNFRLLLEAMARPGKFQYLTSSSQDGPGVLAVLATLLDAEVSLADPHGLLRNDDWPMLQATTASEDQADYIVCDGNQIPGFAPKLGTLPSPEQSATLIVAVDALGKGETELQLTGPGINGTETLLIEGLNKELLAKREDWVCAFPLGVDFIFVDGERIAALPRTTRVEVR